jgi:hypothetical protein
LQKSERFDVTRITVASVFVSPVGDNSRIDIIAFCSKISTGKKIRGRTHAANFVG